MNVERVGVPPFNQALYVGHYKESGETYWRYETRVYNVRKLTVAGEEKHPENVDRDGGVFAETPDWVTVVMDGNIEEEGTCTINGIFTKENEPPVGVVPLANGDRMIYWLPEPDAEPSYYLLRTSNMNVQQFSDFFHGPDHVKDFQPVIPFLQPDQISINTITLKQHNEMVRTLQNRVRQHLNYEIQWYVGGFWKDIEGGRKGLFT